MTLLHLQVSCQQFYRCLFCTGDLWEKCFWKLKNEKQGCLPCLGSVIHLWRKNPLEANKVNITSATFHWSQWPCNAHRLMYSLLINKHCVNMIEVLQSDSYLYIVVELVTGGQLFDIIKNSPNKRLPEAEGTSPSIFV